MKPSSINSTMTVRNLGNETRFPHMEAQVATRHIKNRRKYRTNWICPTMATRSRAGPAKMHCSNSTTVTATIMHVMAALLEPEVEAPERPTRQQREKVKLKQTRARPACLTMIEAASAAAGDSAPPPSAGPGLDLFDGVEELEHMTRQAGYSEGRLAGQRFVAAERSAKLRGDGYSLGMEVGYMSGCVRAWSEAARRDPSALSKRAQATLRSLTKSIAQVVPRLSRDPVPDGGDGAPAPAGGSSGRTQDVVDDDVAEALAEIHAKFRLAKAQCGTGAWLEENVRRLPTPSSGAAAAAAAAATTVPAGEGGSAALASAATGVDASPAQEALGNLVLSESKGELF